MKLSVIVPCYNTAKYVPKCLDSIIENKIDDMEIIVVNDGSTDNTLDILKEYKKKYSKLIKVIDQVNSGLSMARNAGLKVASGEYISFIDSDDYIEKNMYKELLKKANDNFDIVICSVNMVYPTYIKEIDSGLNEDITDKEKIKSVMNKWFTVVWNKIYKRELLKDLYFKKGVWFEDVEFLYRLLPRIKSIGVINGYYYNYIQRPNSITYTYNNKLYHFIENFDGILEYYKQNNLYDEYKDELEYGYVRYLYGTFIKRLAKTKNKKEFKKGYKIVRKKVKTNFPNYQKNKYLDDKKGLYLKHFNYPLATFIYYKERNKMN